MKIPIFSILALLSATTNGFLTGPRDQMVKYLRVDEPFIEDGQRIYENLDHHEQIQIFCTRPSTFRLRNAFQTNRLRLQMPAGGEYRQYLKDTVRKIYEAHHQATQSVRRPPTIYDAKHPYIPLNAHEHICYGIQTKKPFALILEETTCNPDRLVLFILGLVLWVSAPSVASSLTCLYGTAAVLGAHVAGICVIVASLYADSDQAIRDDWSLRANFKYALEGSPVLVALALVGGAWLFLHGCTRLSWIWRYERCHELHQRLLKSLAYWLILCSSDHSGFGWTCVSLIFPFPELWWFLQRLRAFFVLLRRRVLPPDVRLLLSEEEYQAQAAF
ncbi:hypothetical protein KR074_007053, partial [Drosophila pseudoananassae]